MNYICIQYYNVRFLFLIIDFDHSIKVAHRLIKYSSYVFFFTRVQWYCNIFFYYETIVASKVVHNKYSKNNMFGNRFIKVKNHKNFLKIAWTKQKKRFFTVVKQIHKHVYNNFYHSCLTIRKKNNPTIACFFH